MIAVASHRPFSESPEFARNQLRARDSWEGQFDRIIYFGKPEKALAGQNVEFIDFEPFPRIKDMASKCAEFDGWSCIINSDIVVGEEFGFTAMRLAHNHAMCAVSRRYEFVGENVEKAGMVDFGIDFFAATQQVWKRVAREIPDQFRIGHGCWDSYVLGFFNTNYGAMVFDITPTRCIFHPRHGDRKRVHPIDQTVGGRYLEQCGWPRTQMR